jgi:glycosyltransferase involved in cell wall biosynthesis
MAGLVTFLPEPSHIDAQPTKIFEYMSAGIPVIASDFPLWREIIGGSDCGLLVDPEDPAAIAAAIDRLISAPDEACRLGANGLRAVRERYNWSIEENKLLTFYDELVDRS